MTTEVSHRISHRGYLVRQMSDKEYRDHFVDALIRNNVAAQIRTTRNDRGWSQKELAQRCDTRQSVISQLENPDYGRQSLSTLRRLASVFDCALDVRFIPFSEMVDRTVSLSPGDLRVPAFADDHALWDAAEPQDMRMLASLSFPLSTLAGGIDVVFDVARAAATWTTTDDASVDSMPVQTELPGFIARVDGVTMIEDYRAHRATEVSATISQGGRYGYGS